MTLTVEGAFQGDVVDQAIGWHLRLPTASRAEWLAFTDWLEAAAEHAAAYDQITLDDATLWPGIEEASPPRRLQAANDEALSPGVGRGFWRGPGRFAAAGGAVAAALTLTVLNPFGGGTGDQRYVIETAGQGRKQIAFADGSRILMNGGSRMTLDRTNPRFAALDSGEATFVINHDAAHPFELKSGALTLRDLGTVFNVTRDGERLGVQVAEGAVEFEPDGEALTLRPGVTLSVNERSRKIEFARVAPEDVGGWRKGRLSFSATPLASVAAAIGRAGGGDVTVAPALADVPFTGTMGTGGGTAGMVPRLARLTGTAWQRSGDRWILVAQADGTP